LASDEAIAAAQAELEESITKKTVIFLNESLKNKILLRARGGPLWPL